MHKMKFKVSVSQHSKIQSNKFEHHHHQHSLDKNIYHISSKYTSIIFMIC